MNHFPTPGRRSAACALAGAVGAGVLLLASPTQAAPSGYQVARQDLTLAAGGFVDSNARCDGKVALSGGAAVVNSGSADFKTSIQESTNTSVGWATTLRNNDSVSHTIGLFAVCANSPAGYQVVPKNVTVAAGGFVRDFATCPATKVVLGGGAEVTDPAIADFKSSIQETAPATIPGGQSVWTSAVRNNDTASHTIRLFAVCANSPAGYQVVRRDVTVAAGGFVRDFATCPATKVVLGGGVSVVNSGSADFKTKVQETNPSTIPGGQSVWASALRNNDSVSHTVGLFAVCGS